ncbi:MAG: TRAP transporter substrate-binding protein DctP, partial [Nitrospinota bacterium]
MKRLALLFTVLFCAVALVLVLPADVQAAKVIKMKIGHANRPDSPRDRGAKLFAKLIKERTGGRVEVKVFPSAQLGNNRQMVEQTQMGSLECLIMPTAFFGGFNRMVTIVDLPFMFPSIEVFYKVANGPFGQELLKEVEKIKLVGLGYWTA